MHDARAEAERWLAAAREDLEYARYAAAGGHHAPACFFAQQTAEKAIKGVHYLHGALAVPPGRVVMRNRILVDLAHSAVLLPDDPTQMIARR